MSDKVNNLDEPRKNSRELAILRRIKTLGDYLLSLLGRSEIPETVTIPVSVRYAIAHRNSIILKKEIIDSLDPKYGFLGIWLVLKFYEDDKTEFFEIIEQIIRSFSEERKPQLIWNHLRKKLNGELQEKQIQTSGKISFIARMGFVEFGKSLGNLYDDLRGFDSIILVANSGLMAIERILPKLKQNQGELIILFPKSGAENMFYSVSFRGDHLSLKFLSGEETQDKFKDKKVLIIDDISSTGKTENQINQILASMLPDKIEFRTLIKFPEKRESTAN